MNGFVTNGLTLNDFVTSASAPNYEKEYDRLMEENRKLKKEVEKLKEILIGLCKSLYAGGKNNDR